LKRSGSGTSIYLVGLAIFLIVFAYVLLTYTRRVDGTSMLPTLVEGDLVVVQGVPVTDIHLGDIIVYGYPCSTGGQSVIHRVVAVESGGFVTKGDNNAYTDQSSNIANSLITQDCIAGKVVFIVPYIEKLASLPYGTNYLLALLIIFAVLYSEFKSRSGDKKGEGGSAGQSLPNQLRILLR
jgi:signal peptidase I